MHKHVSLDTRLCVFRENSSCVVQGHRGVKLGLDTRLCGIGHMVVYPILIDMPVCNSCKVM